MKASELSALVVATATQSVSERFFSIFQNLPLLQPPPTLVCHPILRIEAMPLSPLAVCVPKGGCVITSQYAIPALAALAIPFTTRIWAVGETTAQRLKAAGFTNVGSGPGTARDFGDWLLTQLQPGDGVVYVRGQRIAFDLGHFLEQHGVACSEHIGYASHPHPHFVNDLLTHHQVKHHQACSYHRDTERNPLCFMIGSAEGARVFASIIQQFPDYLPWSTVSIYGITPQLPMILTPGSVGCVRVSRRPTLRSLAQLLHSDLSSAFSRGRPPPR